MNNINRNELVRTVAMHDIRWIRKNFYSPEFENELYINILLTELSEYHKAQEKEKNAKLPKSLLDFFDKHYNSNQEAIEGLQERLIRDSVMGKQILLLHEHLKLERINDIKKYFSSIIQSNMYTEFVLDENYMELIKLLQISNPIDFVVCCLSTASNTFEIMSTLMYLIGYVGKENICVIYDSSNENKELSIIMNKWNITYDSYLGLGLYNYYN